MGSRLGLHGLAFCEFFSRRPRMDIRHADRVDGRLLWVTIRYGERMRAWVDVGYSVDVER